MGTGVVDCVYCTGAKASEVIENEFAFWVGFVEGCYCPSEHEDPRRLSHVVEGALVYFFCVSFMGVFSTQKVVLGHTCLDAEKSKKVNPKRQFN